MIEYIIGGFVIGAIVGWFVGADHGVRKMEKVLGSFYKDEAKRANR